MLARRVSANRQRSRYRTAVDAIDYAIHRLLSLEGLADLRRWRRARLRARSFGLSGSGRDAIRLAPRTSVHPLDVVSGQPADFRGGGPPDDDGAPGHSERPSETISRPHRGQIRLGSLPLRPQATQIRLPPPRGGFKESEDADRASEAVQTKIEISTEIPRTTRAIPTNRQDPHPFATTMRKAPKRIST